MQRSARKFKTVESYIRTFPNDLQEKLQALRQIIIHAAPGATELISYNMPAYKLGHMLVYFAGHKRHIGFYPAGSGFEKFEKELSGYKTSKGTLQLPYDQPLPQKLIDGIVRIRVKQNLARSYSTKPK